MSSEVSEAPPTEIIPAKSEDKLEIEKEELEEKEKESEAKQEEEVVEEKETSEEKDAAKEAESDTVAGEGEEKDTAAKEEKKKFSLPKVQLKTPKVISDIRSKSKERKKKKEEKAESEEKKDEEKGEHEEEEKKDNTDEGEKSDNPEKKEKSEKKDKLARVKDALDNIKLPNIQKPAFLKKKEAEDGSDTKEGETKEKEDTEDKQKEETDNSSEPKDTKVDESKETTEKADEQEKKESEEKSDNKIEKDTTEENLQQPTKSLMDTIKGLKAPKVPNIFVKGKKKEDVEEKEVEEEEKLLEKGEVDGENKKEEKCRAADVLKTLRHAASGVPALFRRDSEDQVDIELGEGQDLLDKGEEGVDGAKKEDLEEIRLDDEKEGDDKSLEGEKKDLEKGEEEQGGEKKESKPSKNKCHKFHQRFKSLDDQQKMGVVGIFTGCLLFLILIIVIIAAASSPGEWTNRHRLVEGGKYVATKTGCGEVWGEVDGDNAFTFRGIPYSLQVGRFEHSSLPAQLDDCGDEVRMPVNQSIRCARRNSSLEIEGEEDCLYLDIFTPSVVYSASNPVVVYVAGDDLTLMPRSDLAQNNNVVFVVVNVRQGVLGFLSHSALSDTENRHVSGNYGLGDLLTALSWVKANIIHFGGDPGSVTLLGHRQGASLVTAITGVKKADGLYHRIWATGGAGRFSNSTLDDSADQWTKTLEQLCKDDITKDCLLDADLETLLKAVPQDWEVWAPASLPKAGEPELNGMLTIDTQLLTQPLQETWKEGFPVPVVLGTNGQSEAVWDNLQYLEWNDTDMYEETVEGSLGSWSIDLPSQALERYKTSSNWADYMTMISDIRTNCPLFSLAGQTSASMYIASKRTRKYGSGAVADSTTDISAIFARDSAADAFTRNMKQMFFSFVKRGKTFTSVQFVDDDISVVESLENCKFWEALDPRLSPDYGKIF